MRVLLLTDEDFTARESPMVDRLAVGLMGSGIAVARAVPADTDSAQGTGLIARAVYPSSHLPWSWGYAAQKVMSALAGEGWGKDPIDIIHAFGKSCWPLAFAIAKLTGAAVVLEIWAARLAEQLPPYRQRRQVGAYLAPSQPIGAALRAQVGSALVQVAPWGVLAPPESDLRVPLAEMEKSVSAVIVGSGTQLPAYRELCLGLAAIIDDYPQLSVFLSSPSGTGPRLHHLVSQYALDEQVSLIPPAASARALVLQADILIAPERLGEHRSLCLEAMATGMTVVAAEDEAVDYLREGETAHVVSGASGRTWEAVLDSILRTPSTSQARAKEARRIVCERYQASAYIDRVTSTYEKVLQGDAIAFQSNATRGDAH